ncbi:MAG: gamma-glutamyltransferase [Rhizobiales bacterium]|nr:gamma-glutamyltransferase [Hyphomicrobiales bacterium]
MKSRRGAIASGHAMTTEAAAEVLREGGNAFDALLAAMLVATVAEPLLASPAGGGFALLRPTARPRAGILDFFVQTPRRAPASEEEALADFRPVEADFTTASQTFHIGNGTTATPGFLEGFFAIHERLGTLPLARLVEPAAMAAREGVRLSSFQSSVLAIIAPIVTATPGARALFAPQERLLSKGELFRSPAYADVLDNLAIEGADFYRRGELGRIIVEAVAGTGGFLAPDDLRRYRVIARDPLAMNFRDHALALNPPPAAGGTMVALPLALAATDPEERHRPALDARRLSLLQHRSLEIAATTAVNSGRSPGRGPKRPAAPDERLAAALAIIANHRASRLGTTHVSVADGKGSIAAATFSNGAGNGFVHPSLGFMLNNMLGETDVHPSGAYGWQPDRRLSSMMCPTLIEEASGARTVLGSGGSNRIRSAILRVACELIAGRALEPAILAPRVHVETGGTADFEEGLEGGERAALLETFPEARAWPEPHMFFGGVHGVRVDREGKLSAFADPRREGAASIV